MNIRQGSIVLIFFVKEDSLFFSAPLVKQDSAYISYLEDKLQETAEKIQKLCWDNDRFIRGYTEAGERIGAAADPEANMWLNPQSWAVISGLASKEQADAALQNVVCYGYGDK